MILKYHNSNTKLQEEEDLETSKAKSEDELDHTLTQDSIISLLASPTIERQKRVSRTQRRDLTLSPTIPIRTSQIQHRSNSEDSFQDTQEEQEEITFPQRQYLLREPTSYLCYRRSRSEMNEEDEESK